MNNKKNKNKKLTIKTFLIINGENCIIFLWKPRNIYFSDEEKAQKNIGLKKKKNHYKSKE